MIKVRKTQYQKKKAKKEKLMRKRYFKIIIPRKHNLHVTQTGNNLFVNLADAKGNTVTMLTTAGRGFSGRKEIKSFLANITTGEEMAKRLKAFRVQRLNMRFSGIGKNKKALLKGMSIKRKRIRVLKMVNLTPIPFNGCRRKKARHKKGRKKKR
jgi:small subunit ribosomal protein S11